MLGHCLMQVCVKHITHNSIGLASRRRLWSAPMTKLMILAESLQKCDSRAGWQCVWPPVNLGRVSLERESHNVEQVVAAVAAAGAVFASDVTCLNAAWFHFSNQP